MAFDLDTLAVSGDPLPLIDRVSSATRGPNVTISQVGSLAYVPAGGQPDGIFAWVDRKGTEQLLSAPVRPYIMPRLSPDSRQVAVPLEPIIGGAHDVWLYDLAREVLTPLVAGSRSPCGRRKAAD